MTLGYIVECHGASNGALWLDSRNGELYWNRTVTVFPLRRLAQKAILTTLGRRPTWETEFGKLHIRRLVPIGDSR